MEYDNIDFYKAVVGYGELEHDELMDITDGKPIIINGKEVDTISTSLDIDDIDEEICDKIYEFLCDNRNENTDFFNSLS